MYQIKVTMSFLSKKTGRWRTRKERVVYQTKQLAEATKTFDALAAEAGAFVEFFDERDF